MLSPLDFISTSGSGTAHSPEQWLAVTRYVLKELEKFLDVSVHFESPLDKCIDNGLRMDLVAKPRGEAKLGFFYKCILASVASPNTPGLSFGATVFPYCHDKKLIAKTGESFIDLEFRINGNAAEWQIVGWFRDEYGEYDES